MSSSLSGPPSRRCPHPSVLSTAAADVPSVRSQIACYKNTVRAYRSGAQTDLSEVLQIDNVFLNVSKGQVAPAADLTKSFGTTDVNTIVLEILKRGELQVGEKERAVELEELKREICTEVAGRCVDPGSRRPYPVGMIEKAMGEVGYSVHTGKSAKVQVSRSAFSLRRLRWRCDGRTERTPSRVKQAADIEH